MLNKTKRKWSINKICNSKKIESHLIPRLLSRYPREIFCNLSRNVNSPYLYEPSPLKYYGAWDLPDIEYVIDLLTNILNEKNKGSVLVIGSGTGYLLSVLSQIFEECYGIEINKYKHEVCMNNMTKLHIYNVVSTLGDGLTDIYGEKRYDCIIYDCGIDTLPAGTLDLLNPDGSIIAPIGPLDIWPEEDYQQLTLLKLNKNRLKKKVINKVYVTPITKQ